MPDAEPNLQGRVIAGNFRIERLLGRGAMGQVFLAEQLSLGKKVAIKVLHRHLKGDEALAKRFHREAKAASSLNHPNSLQIIDFGQSAEGELFIAMELLAGRDLGRVIHSEFPLPLPRVIRILSQVLSALDEAHVQNIIHRDLKPENIMIIDRRGETDFVKVCDFGIAKIQDAKGDGESGTITMAGVVCGTPEYMSPEQCRGEKLDGRSDLYAVGVILYQMVTGTLPFTAETALGIVTKHLTEQPMPPRQRRPDLTIDPALERLILQAMAKDRGARHATAFEMKEQLESLQRGRTGPVRVPTAVARAATIVPSGLGTGPTPSVPPASPTLAGELVGSGELRIPRGRVGRIAGLALLLAAAGGAGFMVMRNRAPHETASAPSPVAAPAPAPPQPSPPPPTVAETAPSPVAASPPLELQKPTEVAKSAPHPEPAEQAEPAQPPPSPPPAPASAPAPARAPKKPKRVSHATTTRGPTAAAPGAPAGTPAPSSVPARPTEPARPALRPSETCYHDGMELFEQGKMREAIGKFLEAVHHDPSYADAYKYLGKAYQRVGEPETGKKYYRKYLELKPNASDAVFIRSIVGEPK